MHDVLTRAILSCMGFLSGLGSFISDAQQLGEEFQGVKNEFIEQAVSTAAEVSEQIGSVRQELADEKDAALDTIQNTGTAFKSTLEKE